MVASKIFSAVENKMKHFLPSFSRKRGTEGRIESGESEPKKKQTAAFQTDHKMGKMRAEDAERTEMMMVEAEDIYLVENDGALS